MSKKKIGSQGDALKRINVRIKQLRKLKPNVKYAAIRKQASSEFKRGDLGHKGVKSTSKRSPIARVNRKFPKKRVGGTNKSSRGAVDRKKVDITIGSVASGVSKLKKKLIEEIGWKEAAKLTAQTAKSKRNIESQIREKKSLLNKLGGTKKRRRR